MKTLKVLGIAALLTASLVGCSESGSASTVTKDGQTPKVVHITTVSHKTTPVKVKKVSKKNPHSNVVWENKNKTQIDYKVNWSKNYKGLKMNVYKVETRKNLKFDGEKFNAIILRMKVNNTTKGMFHIDDAAAELVTSNGEQISMPDMMGSNFGGGGDGIDGGLKFTDDIVFIVKHIDNLKWVKLTFKYGKDNVQKTRDFQTMTYKFNLIR